jgi:hypothetical protein
VGRPDWRYRKGPIIATIWPAQTFHYLETDLAVWEVDFA